MRRFYLLAGLVAGIPLLGVAAQAPDAAQILAGMRQALGGAALEQVQSFAVKGSQWEDLAFARGKHDCEWVYVRPDRFIRVSKISLPYGTMTDTSGFNGNGLVYRRAASGRAGAAPGRMLDQQSSPSLDRRVLENKRAFSQFVLPLLGVTQVYPYDVSYVGEGTVDRRPVQILTLKSSDGHELRLHTDVATHLPLMISWSAKPKVVVYRSDSGRARMTMKAPPGTILLTEPPQRDPTEGLAPLEHQLRFTDFKVADGLKWPHRMTESVSGEVIAETRLGDFKINQPVEPQLFVIVQRDR